MMRPSASTVGVKSFTMLAESRVTPEPSRSMRYRTPTGEIQQYANRAERVLRKAMPPSGSQQAL